MRKRLKCLRCVLPFGALALYSGCALTSVVLGQTGSIRVIYYAPAWGPNTNGEEVVYFLKQVTFEAASAHENRIYLCSIRPDGSERKEIAQLWKGQPDQFFESYATAVSMDVNKVTRRAAVGVEQGQRGGIFIVNLDGNGFRAVFPREWNAERPKRAGYPTWSPDGKWLAFHEEHDRKGYDGYCIVKCRDDGSSYVLLSDRNESNYEPAWSPNGDVIAYVGDKELHLFLMHPDGSEKRDTKQWGRYPRWSPDGKLIMLEGTDIVEPETGRTVRTTHVPSYPKWGLQGFLGRLPSGIDFTPPTETGTRNLLKNVHRSGGLTDVNKEAFRW